MRYACSQTKHEVSRSSVEQWFNAGTEIKVLLLDKYNALCSEYEETVQNIIEEDNLLGDDDLDPLKSINSINEKERQLSEVANQKIDAAIRQYQSTEQAIDVAIQEDQGITKEDIAQKLGKMSCVQDKQNLLHELKEGKTLKVDKKIILVVSYAVVDSACNNAQDVAQIVTQKNVEQWFKDRGLIEIMLYEEYNKIQREINKNSGSADLASFENIENLLAQETQLGALADKAIDAAIKKITDAPA